MGIALSDLTRSECCQQFLFEDGQREKEQKLDKAIDVIRNKFGTDTIARGSVFRSEDPVGKKHKAQLENRREDKD